MLKYEIYENQSETADKIINSINLGHKRIHVVAPTQSGKTGVIISLANKLKDSNFILTSGMMENHLYEQNANIAEASAMNIKAMKIDKLVKMKNFTSFVTELNIRVMVIDEDHHGIGKTSRIDKLLLLISNSKRGSSGVVLTSFLANTKGPTCITWSADTTGIPSALS